jgi:hypothetical protein
MATQAANAAPPAGEEEEAPEVDEPEPAEDEVVVDDEAEAVAAAKAANEAEGAVEEKPEEEEPEEGEKPPTDEPPKALKDQTVDELAKQLSDDQLRRLGQKFANKTMAAARRSEREVGDVRAQSQRITAELTTYKEFANQFKTEPMTALRRVLGADLTFKQFAEMVAKDPGTAEPPRVDPQVAELRRRLDEKEQREREQVVAENTRRSQAAVQDALAKDPERFDLVLTDIGRVQLWDAIVAYHGKYGSCPDDKVFAMADLIEGRLTEQVAKSKKFTARPSVKTGTPPAAKPNAGAKGKTITNRSSSAAPSKRENATETEEERDRRINAEMRQAGELS